MNITSVSEHGDPSFCHIGLRLLLGLLGYLDRVITGPRKVRWPWSCCIAADELPPTTLTLESSICDFIRRKKGLIWCDELRLTVRVHAAGSELRRF